MEIRKTLVLSTLHITPQTLNHFRGAAFIGEHEYGAYFWVDSEADYYDLDHEMPLDLVAVMRLAAEHGCQEVKFDADGPTVKGLPMYGELWEDL